MVFFNHATRQMTAKIVYYGPGLCGKTTNLNTIYAKTSQKARGEMVSLNTETDRTLFFDLLPMDVGVVGGFKAKLQLYTVPGQVFYNSTRKLVLKGVDGIVFVADSQTPMLDANRESLGNLEVNLKELGLDLGQIPMVFQWNKRDLKNVVPVEELEQALNPKGLPSFQSVAADGTGVFETLRGITRLALAAIKGQHFADLAPAETPEVPAPPPPPPPPPAPTPARPLAALDLDIPRFFGEEAPVLSPPMAAPAGNPGGDLGGDNAPKALDFSDLPSVGDLLEEVTPPKGLTPPERPALPRAPLPMPQPAAVAPLHPPALHASAAVPPSAPVPVLAVPEPRAPKAPAQRVPAVAPRPLLAPKPLAVPRPRVPKPGLAPAPHLGGLVPPSPMAGHASVLHLELPQNLEAAEVEIHVELRAGGKVLAEGSLQRPVPAPGTTGRVSLELKRS